MNDENLIPTQVQSGKEAAEMGHRGGIASGKARRLKSKRRALLLELLELRQPDDKVVADLQRFGLESDDITNEVAMHLRQIDKAIRKGDTNAYREVMKTAGILTEDINLAAQDGADPLGIRIIDTRKPKPEEYHPEDVDGPEIAPETAKTEE